jgi:hypothetical protein
MRPFYAWTHPCQFAGFVLLGAALVALAATFEPGRAAAWARIGLAGTVAGVAVAAALQAVDGIALKVTVDRWVAATGDVRAVVYEAALAVRQIEIGLAALLSVTTGLALIAFSFAMLSTGAPCSFSSSRLETTPSACTALSPSASLFGGSKADCTCTTFCAASFSKYDQPRSRAI